MNPVKLLQMYAEKNASFLHAIGSYNPFGSVGTQLGIATLDIADRCLFTPSAMDMHNAVFTFDMVLPPTDNNVWIHIHQAIEHTYNVQAVFVYNRGATQEIDIVVPHTTLDHNARMHEQFNKFKPFWFLHLVDDTGTVVCKYSYYADTQEWAFFFEHICPFGKCKIADSIRDNPKVAKYTSYEPCEQCKQTMEYWSCWINTALHMIGMDYATSSVPEDFKIEDVTNIERALVPRIRGKGKPKEKDVAYHAPFKMINYDVSIKPASSEISTTDESIEKRANWLTLHGKEDRIYKRIYPGDLDRSYKGEHFKRLIDKCLEGLTLERDKKYVVTVEDKQYTVIIDQDGEVIVVGRVNFPEGKYVPMLKPDLKQHKVIRRITAKMFIPE